MSYMTHLPSPRFWLLTTAALVFGSALPANAQMSRTYQTGAPTMVAAAPGLPSIPADQIARDVTSEVNPRTGARELIAAPFDPFEEDPRLAGSLRLRSVDGGVAIDGRSLNDGAIVEMDFYYNSPSDDPFGGRNYSDVSFVNGELAPVALRDTRVLECSTRVENVVYDQTSYYDRGRSVGIYRPYRHYAGHSSFGFGFGSSYFGPGYGAFLSSRSYGNNRSYRNNRSYGVRGNTRTRSNRPSRRNSDADGRRDRADDRRDRSDRRSESRNNTAQPSRANSRRLTDRDIDERLSRVESYGGARRGSDAGRNARGSSPMRAGNASQRSLLRAASPTNQPATTQSPQSEPQTARSGSRPTPTRNPRSQNRRSQNADADTQRSEPRQTRSRNNTNQRSRTDRDRSRNATRSNQRSTRRSNSSSKRSASSRRSSSNASKRKMNFFPNDGSRSRSVVSSTSVDCAREDKLRIFIPNARLDAARFDGLTLIALDAQGGETPIYLPPNYIEGFRMAATGRVRAQGYQPQPQNTTPQYGTPLPRARIEAAPCPAGTTKQADGTCLQVSTSGYTYR